MTVRKFAPSKDPQSLDHMHPIDKVSDITPERLRYYAKWLAGSGREAPAAVILLCADKLEHALALLDECEPFLKEGETPAQCIKRNRDDWTGMITTLKGVTARAEAAEATLGRVRARDLRLIEKWQKEVAYMGPAGVARQRCADELAAILAGEEGK